MVFPNLERTCKSLAIVIFTNNEAAFRFKPRQHLFENIAVAIKNSADLHLSEYLVVFPLPSLIIILPVSISFRIIIVRVVLSPRCCSMLLKKFLNTFECPGLSHILLCVTVCFVMAIGQNHTKGSIGIFKHRLFDVFGVAAHDFSDSCSVCFN